MTRYQVLTRALGLLLVPAAILVAGMEPVTAEELAFPPRQGKAARILEARVNDGQSRLTISAPQFEADAAVDKNSATDSRSLLVALPRGTTSYRLHLEGPVAIPVWPRQAYGRHLGLPCLRQINRVQG